MNDTPFIRVETLMMYVLPTFDLSNQNRYIMKLLLEKLTRTKRQSNLLNDIAIALPRVFCGLILAFGFGSSKFGMPWSPEASNLALFQVSDWFVEDVSTFGGVFATFPLVFAWLAGASETIGALCLTLGLKTRLSSFFIIITMLVAVFFQKWDNGLIQFSDEMIRLNSWVIPHSYELKP